jgi:hypothetical protein
MRGKSSTAPHTINRRIVRVRALWGEGSGWVMGRGIDAHFFRASKAISLPRKANISLFVSYLSYPACGGVLGEEGMKRKSKWEE